MFQVVEVGVDSIALLRSLVEKPCCEALLAMFALIVCLVLFLLISVTAAAILDAGLIVKPRAQFAQNGFLNLIPKSLPSVLLIPKREVRVWLPPDYHSGPDRTQRHPVLYCHDGQHVLLNEEDTFPPKRSWRLGVTLTNLIKEEQLALPAPIVVLIDNCHKDGVNILGSLYSTILYTIHYTLHTVHYTLYTIHYALYTIHYTLYLFQHSFHLAHITRLHRQ